MWRMAKGPSPSSLYFTKTANYFIKNTLWTNTNLLIFIITISKIILKDFKLINNKNNLLNKYFIIMKYLVLLYCNEISQECQNTELNLKSTARSNLLLCFPNSSEQSILGGNPKLNKWKKFKEMPKISKFITRCVYSIVIFS